MSHGMPGPGPFPGVQSCPLQLRFYEKAGKKHAGWVHILLGWLHEQRGDLSRAEGSYLTAQRKRAFSASACLYGLYKGLGESAKASAVFPSTTELETLAVQELLHLKPNAKNQAHVDRILGMFQVEAARRAKLNRIEHYVKYRGGLLLSLPRRPQCIWLAMMGVTMLVVVSGLRHWKQWRILAPLRPLFTPR